MQRGYSDNYLEDKVLSASPVELVRLLYKGAVEATADARRALREGDVAGRGRAVAKAEAIIGELAQSLRAAEGGADLERNLRRLYEFAASELARGHFEQSDAPFAAAEGVLRTLEEGWTQAMSVAAEAPMRPPVAEHRPLSISA